MAVTVEVHGVLIERGGHELGLPHCTGPRADQALLRTIPGLQDLQRGQQLGTPEHLTAAVVGQGGQRADDVMAADIAAIVAFHAPDGDQHFMVYGVGAADGF